MTSVKLHSFIAIAAVGACFVAPPSLAQTFGFKGLALGSQIDKGTLESTHSLRCGTSSQRNPNVECNGKTTLLGIDATERVVLDAQGRVALIQLKYYNPPTNTVWPKDIAAELSKKFGSPKTNRQNMIFTWVNAKKESVYLANGTLEMKIPREVKAAPAAKLNKKDL